MRKAPLGRAAQPKRATKTICLFCAGTLSVKLAREMDALDRQCVASFGPRRPLPDDFFIWRILQTARINGIELCPTVSLDDLSAEVCTFCEYRLPRYDGATKGTSLTRSNAMRRPCA
jgi:hypothetical protein